MLFKTMKIEKIMKMKPDSQIMEQIGFRFVESVLFVFLFTGQQLPMKFHDDEREIYERLVSSARANGFVVLFPLDIPECTSLPYIATLSRVVQANSNALSMELMGVYRCKVLKYNLGRGEAEVQLLPDVELPSLLPSFIPKYAIHLPAHEKRSIATRINGYPFNAIRDVTESAVNECVGLLSGMLGDDTVRQAKDRGLTYFSYFAAKHIFSNRLTEYSLLKEDSANGRIVAALKYFKVFVGRCSRCRIPIFRNEHIMRLPDQTMTHVNAHGFVHKITLLSEIRNYDRATPPSYEFTWFPEYAWIIIQCSRCHEHLGWEYISMTREPRRFFGIQREGITFQNELQEGDTEENWDHVPEFDNDDQEEEDDAMNFIRLILRR
ncbi:CULT domain-containing protein [Caenorhabditis elegans]|uniref:CULT domain-containing protein n=1 Tax=Caenorhabditis elegans TaxID=6239 RepID=A0A061ACL6_CAEEL|nr:CULT domain-containing protein [Caenorhabditis elegans]CDR32689.1 CULT domain-containing protein [Caenorhabditis elegans]|eukprot:NP_001293924.1 Uncharacterized protein CELE_M18.6 [Caenorhabditis elegans]